MQSRILRAPKRGRIAVTSSISFDRATRLALVRYARMQRRSISDVVRDALRAYLPSEGSVAK